MLPSRFARLALTPAIEPPKVVKQAPARVIVSPEEDPWADEERNPMKTSRRLRQLPRRRALKWTLTRPSYTLLIQRSVARGLRVRRGRIVMFSDPYLVTNAGIRSNDNLQLAINTLTLYDGLIAFDEYHQGRGVTRNAFASYFSGTPVLAIAGQIVSRDPVDTLD